jgi:hypothetical protein
MVMQMEENSQSRRKLVKTPEVGRPRTRPPGETLSLGIKIDPKLAETLDAEAARMTAERPPGSAKISRGELIRVIIHEWLEARSKSRQS